MSVFAALNRAYHNNKQSIPYDQGTGLDPMGKIVPTRYQGVAIINTITKYQAAIQGGRQCVVQIENPVRDQDVQIGDTIYVSGTDNFDGEHVLTAVTNSRAWTFLDWVNDPNAGGAPIVENDGWLYYAPTAKGVIYVDPLRVMSHPSFRQREGEGIYTYGFNPTVTRNFIYHPAAKVDGVIQRTLSSNVFIARPQLAEDVVITEIWLGGDRSLSTLASMFHTFYAYWLTIPAVGEAVGWEPRDKTSDRFLVQIVRVQLGGIDFEFNEVRQHLSRNRDAYLDRQLTLQFKLAKRVKHPMSQMTLEGR